MESTVKMEDGGWVGNLDSAVELLEKSQSALKGLHHKLMEAKKAKIELKQQQTKLTTEVGNLSQTKKHLESKNLKLTTEVLDLRARERKQEELRKSLSQTKKHLESKNLKLTTEVLDL